MSFSRSEEHTSELQSRDSISYAVFCFWKCFWEASKGNEFQKNFWTRKRLHTKKFHFCLTKLLSPWHLELKTSEALTLT